MDYSQIFISDLQQFIPQHPNIFVCLGEYNKIKDIDFYSIKKICDQYIYVTLNNKDVTFLRKLKKPPISKLPWAIMEEFLWKNK